MHSLRRDQKSSQMPSIINAFDAVEGNSSHRPSSLTCRILLHFLQVPSIIDALDALEEGLQPEGGRARALDLLCMQPALVYDTTAASIKERLEALASVFKVCVVASAEMTLLLFQSPRLPASRRGAGEGAGICVQSVCACLQLFKVCSCTTPMATVRRTDLSCWHLSVQVLVKRRQHL